MLNSNFGYPFVGFLYDKTESYNIPFYVAGGLLVFSSVFGYIALYKYKKKQQVTVSASIEPPLE